MRKLFFLLLSGLVYIPNAFSASACSFQDATPAQGRTFEVVQSEIDLGEPDSENAPSAWEGPLVVSKGGVSACSFGLSIIDPPLLLVADRYLYVSTYSGSERVLTILDLRQCRTTWQSPVYFGSHEFKDNHLLIKGKRLVLQKTCLPHYEFDVGPQNGF